MNLLANGNPSRAASAVVFVGFSVSAQSLVAFDKFFYHASQNAFAVGGMNAFSVND